MEPSKKGQQKPLKMGIVQLTRIGDIIQTFQAAQQLKTERPDIELTLIARKEFAQQLSFLLDQVFTQVLWVDLKGLIPSKATSVDQALEGLGGFIERAKILELDVLVNLSFSKSSSYLTSILPARHKMGLIRNNKNEIVIHDKWSQYIYSNVMNNTLNPFNLVDIYKRMLGCEIFEPPYQEKVRKNQIVIHPFASTRKKRWGVNKWVDLLYKLAKENPEQEFFVVGSPSEVKESETLLESPALSEFTARIHNLVGKTSIKETYELLKEAKILLAHDSMVSHLGAIAQIPTVTLSLGPVRPSETSPYQHNVLNLVPKRKCFPCSVEKSCELLPCHKDISHQLASQLVGGIIKEETIDHDFFDKNVSPFYLQNISVLTPKFDEMGMELMDINNNQDNAEDVFKTLYKIIWSFYFKGVELNYPLPKLNAESLSELSNHINGCGYIYELYSFGLKYSKDTLTEAKKERADIDLIQKNVSKLGEIDELCAITKQSYPLLKPIVDFFFVNKGNAQGNNIIDIAESNMLAYHEGQSLISALYDLLNTLVPNEDKRSKAKEV